MKQENPPLEALAMNFLEASPVFLTIKKICPCNRFEEFQGD